MAALRQALFSACIALVVVAACQDAVVPPEPASTDPSTWIARAESGDNLNGQAGLEALEPLIVSVRDRNDRPVSGVELSWAAEGGGEIQPEQPVTRADGTLRAWWTLGEGNTPQLATANSPTGLRVKFRGTPHRSPEIPFDAIQTISFSTFDGSGQVVHPDVVGLPYSWDGGRAQFAMAITPYPGGEQKLENPSIFVSLDGRSWSIPKGTVNPVVRPSSGYFSDPALVYNPEDHRVWMYYRAVVDSSNIVRLVTSADGVTWDAPREILRVPNHGLISPSVVRRGRGEWMMWSIHGGRAGCASLTANLELRRSTDGINWSAPERAALDQPGGFPWHVDVHWVRKLKEYWAIYPLKPAGSCNTPALYLATSPDGLNWTTYPNPVLQRQATTSFADVIYRSSLVYTTADDAVTFYYTGARFENDKYTWSAALQRRDRTELFADLERTPRVKLMRARRGLPNPEDY